MIVTDFRVFFFVKPAWSEAASYHEGYTIGGTVLPLGCLLEKEQDIVCQIDINCDRFEVLVTD